MNDETKPLDVTTLSVALLLLQSSAVKTGRAKVRGWKSAPQWADAYSTARSTWRTLTRRALREADRFANP
jgi:hypothetical protein